MASNDGRHGPRYDTWRQHVIARDTHCGACGRWVDKTLSGRHPWGPTADHIKPWKHHPHLRYDPSNGVLMHRRCNTLKGDSDIEPMTDRLAGEPSVRW